MPLDLEISHLNMSSTITNEPGLIESLWKPLITEQQAINIKAHREGQAKVST
jgi:hypothetical protein